MSDSERIINDLNGLWSQVETAQKGWKAYVESLRYNVTQDTFKIYTETTIAARFEEIESIILPLQPRLQVLIEKKASRTQTLDDIAQLISRLLPNHIIGAETANSMLLRALDAVEHFLVDLRTEIMEREAFITSRFIALRNNYEAVVSIVYAGASHIDAIAPLREALVSVEELADSLRPSPEDEEFKRLAATMDERLTNEGAIARIVERCVLQFKANITFVGVRVARQRLITEFFRL